MEDERNVKSQEEKREEEKEKLKREEEKESVKKPKREEDNWFKHYIELYVMVKITNNSYMEIKSHYDDVLNKDRASFKSSNDEPTPISCIEEMIKKIPNSFWNRDLENVKILDPVCGNGNFHSVIYSKLIKKNISPKNILENILYFNDVDLNRTTMINTIFEENNYNLN